MKSGALWRLGPEGLHVPLQEVMGGVYTLLELMRVGLKLDARMAMLMACSSIQKEN